MSGSCDGRGGQCGECWCVNDDGLNMEKLLAVKKLLTDQSMACDIEPVVHIAKRSWVGLMRPAWWRFWRWPEYKRAYKRLWVDNDRS